MKIGAYQFAVTKDTKQNLEIMKKAIGEAAHLGVKLLAFPECALTGYPPYDMETPAEVDFLAVESACRELGDLAVENKMHIIAGTILKENNEYYNSAIHFSVTGDRTIYHKRALWGCDKENFHPGSQSGVVEIEGFTVGMRICYEVRFPEYFRELYEKKTDLNVILFYDVMNCDDIERYDIVKANVRTRAVENVVYTLAVDTISPFQTAPTVLYDKSGRTLVELKRNEEGILVAQIERTEPEFDEVGRRTISDSFVS